MNLPVAVLYPEGWGRFFELNTTRAIDWGTFWYIGRYLDGKVNSGAVGDQGPFQWLSADIPTLNNLTYVIFALGCLAVAVLALRAPRRPRLAAPLLPGGGDFLLSARSGRSSSCSGCCR